MLKDEKNLASQTNNFPKDNRLYGRNALRNVVQNGKRLKGKVLSLSYIDGEPTRFAISVLKRYGKAVARNRIKRIIREFLRQNKYLWPENRWVIIKVYKNLEFPCRRESEAEIIEELKKLFGLIK